MSEMTPTPAEPTPADAARPLRRRRRRLAAGAGLLAAGALAGGLLAGTLSASAETTPSAGSSSSTGAAQGGSTEGRSDRSGQSGQRGPHGSDRGADRHGSAPVRDDEKALDSASAEKVKAAALKAVPGGTVYRVETDAGDGEYEAHMTKADGTEVTAKLDADFSVTAVEDGMGRGDPARAGGHAPNGQAPSGEAPNGQTPSQTPSSGT